MEDIINKIIAIDDNAKNIIKKEKEKEKRLDETIKNEFYTKKVVLDLQYKDTIEEAQNKLDEKIKEKSNEIDEKTKEELRKIENEYAKEEKNIMAYIIENIKKQED